VQGNRDPSPMHIYIYYTHKPQEVNKKMTSTDEINELMADDYIDAQQPSVLERAQECARFLGISDQQFDDLLSILQSLLTIILIGVYVIIFEPLTCILVEKRQLRWKIQGNFAHAIEKVILAVYDRAFKVELIGLENVDPAKLAIVTSNHQTLLDYLTIACCASKCGIDTSTFFFVWKHCVRLPSISVLYNEWLRRSNWKVPSSMLSDVLSPVLDSPWREDGGKWLVVFPEVTPWSASSMVEQRALCAQNGCPKLQNLLYPRFNAFVQAASYLRDYPVTDIYELTILYVNTNDYKVGIPGWRDVLLSQKDWRIRVEIKKRHVSSVPHKEKHIVSWLEKQWYEQDRSMTEFKKEIAKGVAN